jgi:hypothetical protein
MYRKRPRGVCGAAECQRARHRLACTAWRERQREEECRHRLRQGLSQQGPDSNRSGREVAWDVVRDAVSRQRCGMQEESGKVVRAASRDGIVRGASAP